MLLFFFFSAALLTDIIYFYLVLFLFVILIVFFYWLPLFFLVAVRLPGLSTGGTEYSFKIVPSHSTAGYPPSDPSSRVRSLRIQSQCGCVGSVGNGAPVNPTMVQSWDGNLKGSQWELGFDDASVCDTGIKVYSTNAGGTEQTNDVAVQATEQTCRPDFNRRVVSSERQDVPSTAGIGDTMTYCLVSSDKALYNSERACVNSAINWAGRVNGFVKTTSGEAVVNCKVWLEADTWDGWSDVDVLSGIGFKDSVPKISNIGAALPTDVNLAQCKARCIDIPTCVAIERTEDSATTSSCRFYGPWSANFREGEGEGSTTSQFAGFNANTYFMVSEEDEEEDEDGKTKSNYLICSFFVRFFLPFLIVLLLLLLLLVTVVIVFFCFFFIRQRRAIRKLRFIVQWQ